MCNDFLTLGLLIGGGIGMAVGAGFTMAACFVIYKNAPKPATPE